MKEIKVLNKNELQIHQAKQILKCKSYNFFVCNILDGLQVLSGWEYANDALDSLRDEREVYEYCKKNVKLKVYTRTYLNNITSK